MLKNKIGIYKKIKKEGMLSEKEQISITTNVRWS